MLSKNISGPDFTLFEIQLFFKKLIMSTAWFKCIVLTDFKLLIIQSQMPFLFT